MVSQKATDEIKKRIMDGVWRLNSEISRMGGKLHSYVFLADLAPW